LHSNGLEDAAHDLARPVFGTGGEHDDLGEHRGASDRAHCFWMSALSASVGSTTLHQRDIGEDRAALDGVRVGHDSALGDLGVAVDSRFDLRGTEAVPDT